MKKLSALAALSLLAVVTPARAEKTRLSDIPVLPAAKDAETPPPKTSGVAGLTVNSITKLQSTSAEITAAKERGYCLVEHSSTALFLTESTWSADSELWRFTEKDRTATLERTRFELAESNSGWMKSRTTLALRAVASEVGVTIWSMREANGDVVFLAANSDGGREGHLEHDPDDTPIVVASISNCSFAATRISAYTVTHGGGVAHLSGTIPADKGEHVHSWAADISLFKLSRDPEPIVTVRVRTTST